jgi:hypothetical protein
VLFIEHALHLADRAQGGLSSSPRLPEAETHHRLRRLQCWGLQKRLRKEGRPRESGKLKVCLHAYKLTDRYTRLRVAGKLTAEEVAERLGLAVPSVKGWQYRGLLQVHRYTMANRWTPRSKLRTSESPHQETGCRNRGHTHAR